MKSAILIAALATLAPLAADAQSTGRSSTTTTTTNRRSMTTTQSAPRRVDTRPATGTTTTPVLTPTAPNYSVYPEGSARDGSMRGTNRNPGTNTVNPDGSIRNNGSTSSGTNRAGATGNGTYTNPTGAGQNTNTGDATNTISTPTNTGTGSGVGGSTGNP